jgi:hypothetical protein
MKNPRKSWTPTEKWMLIATLILFVILSVKSLFFDAITGKTPEEQLVIHQTVTELKNETSDFWHQNNLVVDRIVAIKSLTDKEIEDHLATTDTTALAYKVKLRSYFLYIIPFSDKYRIFNDRERKSP